MSVAPCHPSASVQLVETHKGNILGILTKPSSSCQHFKHRSKTLYIFSLLFSFMIRIRLASFILSTYEHRNSLSNVAWAWSFKELIYELCPVNARPQILIYSIYKLNLRGCCKGYGLKQVTRCTGRCQTACDGLWPRSIKMPQLLMYDRRKNGRQWHFDSWVSRALSGSWMFWGSGQTSAERQSKACKRVVTLSG